MGVCYVAWRLLLHYTQFAGLLSDMLALCLSAEQCLELGCWTNSAERRPVLDLIRPVHDIGYSRVSNGSRGGAGV